VAAPCDGVELEAVDEAEVVVVAGRGGGEGEGADPS
jgi:cell division GTPase FtsZ